MEEFFRAWESFSIGNYPSCQNKEVRKHKSALFALFRADGESGLFRVQSAAECGESRLGSALGEDWNILTSDKIEVAVKLRPGPS